MNRTAKYAHIIVAEGFRHLPLGDSDDWEGISDELLDRLASPAQQLFDYEQSIGPLSPMPAAALGYAAIRDWAIFPADLTGKEKKSCKSAKYSNGAKWGKTRDLEQIRRDFQHWREANIGVPTGKDNRIWVLEALAAKGVTRADFRAHLPDHSYIFTPTGAFWSAAGVNACLPPTPVIGMDGEPVVVTRGENKGKPKTVAATVWLDRNQPLHHLTWAPGHPMIIENQLVVDGEWVERNGLTTFNLYRPPTLKHGDPSKAGPWLELAHKVYADDAERLIICLAHRVQRPQEKINHAVLLGGPPGIGKDTILEPVKRAVGAWNWKETSPQQIMGRFNGHLQSVIMRINEVRDLGEFNR